MALHNRSDNSREFLEAVQTRLDSISKAHWAIERGFEVNSEQSTMTTFRRTFLTATKVRRGSEMRKHLDERVLNASSGDEQGVFTDALEWFEPNKETVQAVMTMRVHLSRGWCKGVVGRTSAPKASPKTFTVTTQFEGDHGPRDIRLLRENCGDTVNCKADTWHFTRPTTPETDM